MTNKDNGGPASDKIQQARRAAFEASLESRNKHRAESGFDALKPDEVRQMWWAFNAALDCVVIELPAHEDGLVKSYGPLLYRDEVVDAIESTNLGIKVK